MKDTFSLLLLFFGLFKICGQSNFDAGFLPKIVLSHKVSNRINWVNSLESRAIIYDGNYQFSHNLIDVSSILSLKTNLNQSFNFGYIIRFRNAEKIYRTFQHYNFVSQFSSLKLAHRFAFEQFYQSDKQTTFRTRYRVSMEKPLNGERLDIKEFYLKFSNEYLYDFERKDLEIRGSPNLGFKASKKDKIEVGLDYRLSNFINNSTRNNLWFRTTWYISMD
jgi:hypothetical protein